MAFGALLRVDEKEHGHAFQLWPFRFTIKNNKFKLISSIFKLFNEVYDRVFLCLTIFGLLYIVDNIHGNREEVQPSPGPRETG